MLHSFTRPQQTFTIPFTEEEIWKKTQLPEPRSFHMKYLTEKSRDTGCLSLLLTNYVQVHSYILH